MKQIWTNSWHKSLAFFIMAVLLLNTVPLLEVRTFALNSTDSALASVTPLESTEQDNEQSDDPEESSTESGPESDPESNPDPDPDPDPEPEPEPEPEIEGDMSVLDAAGDYTYTLNTANEATITGYTGSDTNLTIPDEIDGYPVNAIESSAFQNKTALQSVVIPDSVTSIGNYAFSGCTALSSVTLSNNLLALGRECFYNTAITSIEIPQSLTTVSNSPGPFVSAK